MPKLIINDTEYECRPGERLLSVARRNGAHIGFVCMGRGYCHTCACRVESGAEHLSPPTELEKNWHKTSHLRDNNRLACQTFLRGPGPVSILSRAEELRRQATQVIAPPEGTTSIENLSELLGKIGGIAVHIPSDIIGVASYIGKKRLSPKLKEQLENTGLAPELENLQEKLKTTKRYTPNIKIIRKVIDDTNRMAQNMMGTANGIPADPSNVPDAGVPQSNEPEPVSHRRDSEDSGASHQEDRTETMHEIPVPAQSVPVTPIPIVAEEPETESGDKTPPSGDTHDEDDTSKSSTESKKKPRKVNISMSK